MYGSRIDRETLNSQKGRSPMVTDYKIITGETKFEEGGPFVVRRAEDDFETLVKKAISDGWVPLGGVCETVDPSYKRYYAQAMIKEER